MNCSYSYFVKGAAHVALAQTSMDSVRAIDSKAHFVVVGEQMSGGDITHIPFNSTSPMMLANLEAQNMVLATLARHTKICFLDTDILVLEELPIERDLTITWRDHIGIDEKGEKIAGVAVTMPYNYGVIGVVNTYETQQAFIFMRERIRRMSQQLQKWYGNQVALASLAGPPATSTEISFGVRRIPWLPFSHGDQVNICQLPGERWNYTPRMVGERVHGKRSILHFKGPARALMESYARRINIPWHTTVAA